MSYNRLICIAACAGAFGVRGEVKIKSFTQDPENCFSYGNLRGADGAVLLSVTSYRVIKNGFAATCPQIDTREQAKALGGTQLYVYRKDMPEPEEDEFYFEDLIDCEVKTTDGKRMGKVLTVHNYGAGDLLEISGGKDKKGNKLGMFFHPFNVKTTPVVDIGSRKIVILIEEAIIAKED
ncbi:MAG: ribosome maturation factor RimM [Robiginitomaculum sp.]